MDGSIGWGAVSANRLEMAEDNEGRLPKLDVWASSDGVTTLKRDVPNDFPARIIYRPIGTDNVNKRD